MNLKARFHIKTLFAKLFLSYMLMLTIVALFLSIFLFNLFSQSSTRQVNEISEKTLAQSLNSVEFIMDQAMQLCSQLSFDNDIIQQMYTEELDSVNETKVLKKLNETIFVNSSLYSICIYNSRNGKYLTTDYPNLEQKTIEWLDKNNIRQYTQVYPRWLPLGENGSMLRKVYSVFAYDRNIETGKIESAIIINIKEEAIQKSINSSSQSSYTLVLDQPGNLVSTWGEDFLTDYSQKEYMKRILTLGEKNFIYEMEGEKTLATYAFSKKLGWYFVYLLPYKEATSSITYLRNLLIAVCFILLTLGILAAAILSGRLSSPFSAMVKNITSLEKNYAFDADKGLGEAEILSRFYSNITKKIENLEIIKESSFNRLKGDYIRELLQGARLPNRDDMAKINLNLDLHPSQKAYVILIRHDRIIDMRNNENEEFHEELDKKIRMAISSICIDMLSDIFNCEAVEIEGDVAVIATTDGLMESRDKLEDLLNEVQKKLKDSIEASVTIAFGTSADDIAKISDSYQHAKEICNYKLVYGEGSVLTHGRVFTKLKQEFDYPYNKEKVLLESIRLGKEENIEPALEDIFNSLKYFSYDFIMLSINHLLLSVFVAVEMTAGNETKDASANFSKALIKIRQMETMEQIRRWFVNFIGYAMQKVKETRKKSGSALFIEIEGFMQANFSNPSLSVEMAADKFNYNPIYFGKLFKDLFNKSFLEYLTALRVEKAIQYLGESKITIKELSTRVGFNNPTYFMTCFKKIIGVSPNEYRQRHFIKD